MSDGSRGASRLPDRRTGPADADFRASDAERERVAGSLREHAAAGRLSMDELTERLDQAYAGRTRGQLDAIVADLPERGPTSPAYTHRRAGLRAHARAFLAVNLLLIAIWATSGAGYFWPMWPLLGWGIGLASHARGCGWGRGWRRSA
ncbi:MAG: DUF1707 domain-containing protein [Actinomycetota bacterium]|nr:DUF1707 domain-containing protein [Actinomycetota bacterium]